MSGGSSKSWYGSDSKVWAVVGTIAAAVILACGLIHMSTNPAAAQPGCTASGLSSALATVASGTAGWLASHPEAEAAVNSADENTIRTYFATHTDQWSSCRASPIRCAACAIPARSRFRQGTWPGCSTR